MFKSLKSKMLLTGSLLFIVIAASAIYGRILFEETINLEITNTQNFQKLNRIITRMKYPVVALESTTYKYLISLEKENKTTLFLHLKELKTQLKLLEENPLTAENKLFNSNVKTISELINKLDKYLIKLSQFSPSKRYPITALMASSLNPNTEKLYSSLQILSSLVDEIKSIAGLEHVDVELSNLKYAIAQIINTTRLLMASKTEIFGTSEQASIKFLLENFKQYNKVLDNKIIYLRPLKTTKNIDPEIAFAYKGLIQAKIEREQLIKHVVNSLKAKNWRADVSFTDQNIAPIYQKIIGEFNHIERRLEFIAKQNMDKTKDNASTLSSLLWLYAVLTLIVFLLTYLFTEKWIRRPLIKVSNAMHFEREQVLGNKLKEIGIKEIDRVISAFNYMSKEIKIRQLKLSYILKNAGETIILIHQNGKIDAFNSTAEEIFAYSEAQARTLKIQELLEMPHISKDIAWLKDNQNNTKQLNYFTDAFRSDNSSFKCDVTLSLMILNTDIYGIVVARDATKRLENESSIKKAKEEAEQASEQLQRQVIQLDDSMKKLKSTQKQLIASEKNASLASLVAGVAHEINTPIGVGVTASSLMTQEVNELKKLVECNKITKNNLTEFLDDTLEASIIIDTNLKRASELVKNFKMVAVDQQSDETREINLKEYIDGIILSLRPKLKKTQHTIETLISDKILIHTSPGALSQIFTNLIMNSLTHGFEHISFGAINITAKIQHKVLIINYSDDGKGMSPEQINHVFDPFYTSKRGEGGSGLGMHIVYNLVTQKLNGDISCSSEINGGCQFKMHLPLSSRQ